MRSALFAAAAAASLVLAVMPGRAQNAAPPQKSMGDLPTPAMPDIEWPFDGVFGTFDRAALQRGFQVYSEVCSLCHAMNLMHYRDLGPEGPGGGIGYTDEQVKAIAATPFINGRKVTDGPDGQGKMFERDGRPSDKFVAPFDNPQAAAALYHLAPPDLSVMAKARAGGPTYIYAYLTGYKKPPQGMKVSAPYLNFNDYFPGHETAMPQPLAEGRVTYQDGTKATLDQEARDIVTFLAWAAEPTREDRKRTGTKVLLFLLVMTGALYGTKRKIWSDVH